MSIQKLDLRLRSGKSLTLAAVYDLYLPSSGVRVSTSAWICVFGVIQLLLSLLKNFNSLQGIFFLAAIMSLGYCTTAFALTLHNGKQPGAVYDNGATTIADRTLSGFNRLGIIAQVRRSQHHPGDPSDDAVPTTHPRT